MSDTVIKVENVGKLYRLGEIGTGTISHDLNRWFARVRGKEDPFAIVGETNDRTAKGTSDYVWALKGVSFEVKAGEVLGIIGRNGAGKSTLLKILSKVTTPSQGKIKVKGRIASLLEVGTGFHPELTGRENVFLNGAILGMTKAEIKSKFDEIVDFSGVERYIDTPVKRYSSGMYVRLAFAVAAFLEPEILIIDEVLAVGDAEFQKKCLGRMREVSVNDGRTVIFVSHNMTAVRSLCNNGVLLKNGTVSMIDSANNVVDDYLQNEDTEQHKKWEYDHAPGTQDARLLEVHVQSSGDVLYIENPMSIYFKVQLAPSEKTIRKINLSLVVNNQEGLPVFNVASNLQEVSGAVVEGTCHIPADLLNDDYYQIRLLAVEDSTIPLFDLHDIMTFKMEEKDRGSDWHGKWVGTIRPSKLIKWT